MLIPCCNRKVLSLLILLSSTGFALAQSTEANQLHRIMDLFGGTWVGEGTATDGGKFKTELKFEWTLNKRFIKVTNFITANKKSQLYAETTYGWQPVLRQIVFWSFDNDGNINEGVATLDESTLHHEWRSFSGNGQIKDWQSRMVRVRPGFAAFTLLEPRAEGWVESLTIKYRRKK
ncbi:MAG: hypothetical protein ACE5HO_17325 [bacterium]